MLPGILLLLLSSASPAESLSTLWPTTTAYGTATAATITATTAGTTAVQMTLPSLSLSVSALENAVVGRAFVLSCSITYVPPFTILSWQRFEDETWREVGQGRYLNVTEPERSGMYRCRLHNSYSQSVSNNITVHIIDMEPKEPVPNHLGIAALVLSLVASITSLSILGWLVWRSYDDPLPALNNAAKGFPGTDKTPNGPRIECNSDVYMNYNTNQAYSDLDPASMSADGVYSSLS